MKPTQFSIGICAYNEAQTIGKLLQFLLKEKFTTSRLSEIIVVASGCTDGTEAVVLQFSRRHPQVKLITQKKRQGKSSAVNLIIKHVQSPFIVLIGADVLPKKGATEKLLQALKPRSVGLVGGRIIPTNPPHSLIGFAVNLQWKLHHLISLHAPKAGEMIAFKKIFKRINPKTPVDEAIIECLVATQGYQIRYEPTAVVYNSGPTTLRDFLRQRRRIYAGHLATKTHYNYTVSTFTIWRLIPYVFQVFQPTWRFFLFTPLVAFLELVARAFGWADFHFKTRDHSVWEIVTSAKISS